MDDEEGLTKTEMVAEYHHLMARRLILLALCIAGIILFVGLFSLSVYPDITLKETYEIIWHHLCGDTYERRTLYWWADRYIWNTAMPHVVVAILAGCSLAVCGTLMQAIMGNPLADPYTTGISSGACFGAVAAIVVGASFSTVAGEMGIVTNAFIGALVPAIIIIILADRIRMTPATLILLGTAISYFFNALVTYLMITTDADTLKDAYLWQIGHLDGMTWDSVPIMLVTTIIGSIIVLAISNKLNVMTLGDSSAQSLGIDVQNFRVLCLALMAVMTAAIISFTGIIGFVGLVAPHIVRLVIGSDNRFVVPISMAFGALLLLFADYLTTFFTDMPVGVIMGIIGSPVFFLLIVFQNKKRGAIY